MTVEVAPVVAHENDAVPAVFALDPNYPNPFDSHTMIDSALPEAAHVTIAVYDAHGRRVVLLVDGYATAGYHSAAWDARELASGVYFYRMEAGPYAETRTMSVVR